MKSVYLSFLEKVSDAVWPLAKNESVTRCQLNSYHSSPEWLRKAGRMISHFLSGHSEEHPIISQPTVWKVPPSCHWTDHSGGYWQQAKLHTEMVQAEQWWWWWHMYVCVY